ncbi:MAG TPA: hypothetical protein VG269_17430 [Tepidisphaeraceae bacterium]|jgi:hypothetical protein|nr:hypothetical protein [Tepidisphaeraceae bacterium]
MKIKALENFAHASKKSFVEGRVYDVQEKTAEEFLRGALAELVIEAPKAETKPVEKKKD